MEIENLAVRFIFIFLVLFSQPHDLKTLYKLRITWYKIDKIAGIKSTHLQPDHHFLASHVLHAPNTHDSADNSDSDNDNPSLPDAAVSSFSGSGVGWLTTDASRRTLSYVGFWLIYERRIWETETDFDGRSLMVEISVNFIIRWLPDRYINGYVYTYRWEKNDGDGDMWCLFQIPDINIHLSIDQLINRSIFQRKEEMEGGTHQ